jgi:hypothetical protein
MKPFLLAFFVALAGLSPLAAQTPKDLPEMKVLQQFVGSWKYEATFFKSAWNPEEKHLTGTVTTAATLDGSYIEEKGTDGEGGHSQKMYTFDLQGGGYRAWWFSSRGLNNESTGTWDADKHTLTWTTKLPAGPTGVTTQHFVDEKTIEWAITFKDAEGNVTFRAEGKSTRQ